MNEDASTHFGFQQVPVSEKADKKFVTTAKNEEYESWNENSFKEF